MVGIGKKMTVKTLDQTVHEGCRISVLGDNQSLTEKGSEQPGPTLELALF